MRKSNLMTKTKAEQNITVCELRINGLKKCIPGIWEIAALEITKAFNMSWLAQNG